MRENRNWYRTLVGKFLQVRHFEVPKGESDTKLGS